MIDMRKSQVNSSLLKRLLFESSLSNGTVNSWEQFISLTYCPPGSGTIFYVAQSLATDVNVTHGGDEIPPPPKKKRENICNLK